MTRSPLDCCRLSSRHAVGIRPSRRSLSWVIQVLATPFLPSQQGAGQIRSVLADSESADVISRGELTVTM